MRLLPAFWPGSWPRALLLGVASLTAPAACSLTTDLTSLQGGTSDDTKGPVDASPVSDVSTGRDVSTADAPDASTLDQGIVGHWSLDEGSGGVANDDSPSRVAFTIGSAAWTAGTIGGALKFNGVNDFAETQGDVPELGTAYTVALWVRLDAAITRDQRIVSADLGTLTLFVGSTGYWAFHWNDTPGTTDLIRADRVDDPGIWHHLAGTHDGTTARLYVDHVLRVSKARGTASRPPQKFYLGSSKGVDLFTQGTVDELRVYRRALSADEIRQL